ncbi:nicotinamide-nucleotide amidase [Serratia microhaemolytica]|uniref:nicotinamide-nucleotide amidase n=1 Tax=Serratia microhaemolytica TaxID=2675110 RepID=UPI000FDF434B|nr:nicotinamide-nucleotide amidase [Serratia microhaemolytica]
MTTDTLHALSTRLGEKLLASQRWITCAESCTGGGVAQAITEIAGSSAYFDRAFVTYSDAAKQQLLSVPAQLLEQYGAVSEAVVRQMALGALTAAKADLAIAVSGIAGPGGGSEQKPVGTVWFGFANSSGHVVSYKQQFSGDRQAVRNQAVVFAIKTVLSEFL